MILSPHSFWQAFAVASLSPALTPLHTVSLQHYSLHSLENNMSGQDMSQTTHVSCCSCLFTLLFFFLLELSSVPASPFSQLPLPPSFVSSADSLSLRTAASVFTLTHDITSHSDSVIRWMLDDFHSLGVAAYFSSNSVFVCWPADSVAWAQDETISTFCFLHICS